MTMTYQIEAKSGEWKAEIKATRLNANPSHHAHLYRVVVRLTTVKGNVAVDEMEDFFRTFDPERLRMLCALRAYNLDDTFDPRRIVQ